MIVTRKIPAVVKSPVHVSDTQLEIWYARPISLGIIDRVGYYWYTVDGMRFTNSRLAMDYLIQAHEEGRTLEPRKVEPRTKLRKGTKNRKSSRREESPLLDLDLSDPVVQQVLELLRTKYSKGTNVQ